MSSLFSSKRRRPPNQPLTTSTAHSDAATAALSAFSRRESTPSLSEAAAAAALKARPHTPTDVSSIVSKRRSARRSASNSSHGTASPRPPLERAGSAGSMRDRAFRSPSPHGRQPVGGANGASAQPTEYDAPPVPSIPRVVQASQQQAPQGVGSLRITSTPVRVASQKLKDGSAKGTGTWFGAPSVGDLSNVRTSDTASATTGPVTAPPKDPYPRPESRSSVNFSYPSRLRLGSPPPPSLMVEENEPRQLESVAQSQARAKRSSMTTSQPTRRTSTRQRPASTSATSDMVYDPNSRRMVSRAELMALEQILDDAEPRQSPKKKKLSRAGSHLSRGSVSRTQVAEPVQPHPEPAPASPVVTQEYAPPATSGYIEVQQPVVDSDCVGPASEGKERVEQPVQSRASTDRGREVASPSNYLPEVVVARRAETSSPPEGRPTSYMLGKRPSIIEEQVEMEASEYERPPSLLAQAGAVEPVSTRQHTYDQPAAAPEPRQPPQAPQQNSQPVRATVSPAELSAEALDVTHMNEISEEKPPSPVEPRQAHTIRSQRTHSNSPVRVAHFGPVQRTLSVRHSPPPRSISPRKSALKQHSPPRSNSSDDGPESSATSPTHEDAALARKKSVRVSFNDKETVVRSDEPADAPSRQTESPNASSPPSSGRRTWFSNMGRSKKKDVASFDDDEVMKPRPALPSFGSVREKKKPREEEERPLVRPADPANLAHSPEAPTARPSTGLSDGGNKNGLGPSGDRAIGGVLSQDYASRIPANTSRFREPLPPVVTSREGSGYISNTDSSSDSDEELLRDTPTLSSQPSAATSVPDPESESKSINGFVSPSPTIITSPVMTPTIQAEASRSQKSVVDTRKPGPAPTLTAAVPAISISEPSSRLDERSKPMLGKIVALPGGFPDDDDYEHTSAQQTSPSQATNDAKPASARQVTFEPVSQALDSKSTIHTPATVAATHPAVTDDSDSDGSSIYSDAYEDPADMDNDGFQSIDAILESPVVASASVNPLRGRAPVEVPEAEPVMQRPPTPVASPAPEVVARAVPFEPLDDWEAAKAFWRSLTADKRAQFEREAAEEAGAEADLEQEAKVEAAKPRRKKSVEKRQAEKRAIQESAHGNPERVYMVRPGTKVEGDAASPVLRKSMRQEEPQEAAPTGRPVLRKSMRGNAVAGQQRPSTSYTSPDAQPNAAPRRPMSSHVSTTQAAAGAAHRTHDRTNSDASSLPQRSGAMTSFFPPVLKRRGSTSSESSFRRSTTRRASAAFGKGESGGFSMRRTLRSAASPEQEQGEPSRRFSLRSFSPADSTRRGQMAPPPPVSFNNQQRMRSSLRDSKSKDSKVKGDGSGIHIPSLFRPKSSKGKKSSRFDDSSDEEGGVGGSGFRSRFEDSSDDEAAAPPTPLPAMSTKTLRSGAGASRPQTVQEEAESPDLPDSDDDEKPVAPVRATVGRATSSGSGRLSRQAPSMGHQNSRSGRGAALGTSLMKSGAISSTPAVGSPPASPTGRRGSFMSTVLRRKRTGGNEPGKIQRGEVMDSAARRDTALERSTQELSALRAQRRTASMPMVPTTQRSHSGHTDQDWPLATPVDEDDEERTIASSRPSFAKRRSLSQGDAISGVANDDALVLVPNNMDEAALATGAGPQKKKKRFPALRRMFRLDD
ncbi:hypothetical protein RB595_009872 [Gaeumannomyces hyphopodioides]